MATSPLDQFRAAVMADDSAQLALAQILEGTEFAARAVEWARAHGIALTPADIASATAPDPLGIARFGMPQQIGANWPPPAWLPIRAVVEGGYAVDWMHFADVALDQSFYADNVREASVRPFNRLFRYRTAFDDFVAAQRGNTLAPDGLIFHMSRCGSTLAAQMLAASPANIVASEPDPLDAMVQLPVTIPALSPEIAPLAVRTMIDALGRKRSDAEQRYFLKADCWHTLALPLFRQALPGMRWVFLFRDPVEVIVSHLRRRGLQTVPGALPPALFGAADSEDADPVGYIAHVLHRICAAAIEHADENALFVDYRELPDALFTRILPHFGVTPSADERAAMTAAARRDSKQNSAEFRPDSAAKQHAATDEIRDAARSLDEVHARLRALSTTTA